MKYFLILLIWFPICCTTSREASSSTIPPEPSPIVLDHLYFMVPDRGKEAIRLLTETGFIVHPRVFQITGEGKASRTVLLDNIYLEILWVDDSVSFNSFEQLQADKRKTWHSGNPISPFGVAFRRAAGVGDSISIPSKRTDPEPAGSWAGEGNVFHLITDDNDTLSTYLFVIPPSMAFDSHVPRLKEKTPESFNHPNGVKALTSAVIYSPEHAIPAKEKYISNVPMVRFKRATENYAVLEFDNGKQKLKKDLRPALPLVLIW